MRGLGWVQAHTGYNGFSYSTRRWHVAASLAPRQQYSTLCLAKTLCGRDAYVTPHTLRTEPPTTADESSCAVCARKVQR